MSGFLTIREASTPAYLDRSPAWIRFGIKLGKIRAEKIGNTFAIPLEEVLRIKSDPPTISRQEIAAC